eukprot:3972995-Prymnesium_polylepis.1
MGGDGRRWGGDGRRWEAMGGDGRRWHVGRQHGTADGDAATPTAASAGANSCILSSKQLHTTSTQEQTAACYEYAGANNCMLRVRRSKQLHATSTQEQTAAYYEYARANSCIRRSKPRESSSATRYLRSGCTRGCGRRRGSGR